jgi:hypothetical protein
MALQTQSSGQSPQDAYNNIRNVARGVRAQGITALAQMQSTNINTPFVYSVLDTLNYLKGQLMMGIGVSGLDSYATAQGYNGSMVADCNAVIAAATAVIVWVYENFPTANGFVQGETLNEDGTRTPAQFTPAQTGGFQVALAAFNATIN